MNYIERYSWPSNRVHVLAGKLLQTATNIEQSFKISTGDAYILASYWRLRELLEQIRIIQQRMKKGVQRKINPELKQKLIFIELLPEIPEFPKKELRKKAVQLSEQKLTLNKELTRRERALLEKINVYTQKCQRYINFSNTASALFKRSVCELQQNGCDKIENARNELEVLFLTTINNAVEILEKEN